MHPCPILSPSGTIRGVDSIIVGGGIIGASIAWRLAQAGYSVLVVEASTLGAQASGAAAGMLAPGGEFEPESPIALQALSSLRMYPDFVRELSEEGGEAIDFRQCGAIELPGADPDALLGRARRQQAIGIPSIAHVDGSVFYPEDAVVDPRELMRALGAACRNRGVQLLEHTRVAAIELSPAGARVAGVEARTVVIAAGAWSSSIEVRGAELPESFPVRGHLLGYKLEPNLLPSIRRRGHIYIFQRSSGYTIAGSDAERAGFDPGPDPVRVAALKADAADLWPYLVHCEPDDVWTGFRPATYSPTPHVRRIAGTRLWLAYGHYRNGILLAPHTAALVASEIIATLETD